MIDRHKCGSAFGILLGTFHLIWAWLVLTGIAQTVMNWIFRLHFIEPPYTVLPFNLGVAVALIVITTMIGYVAGWTLAAMWNWLGSDAKRYRRLPAIATRHQAMRH